MKAKAPPKKNHQLNGHALSAAMVRRLRSWERGGGHTFKTAAAAVRYLEAQCAK